MLKNSIYLANVDANLAGYLNICSIKGIDFEFGHSNHQKLKLRDIFSDLPSEQLALEDLPEGEFHPGSLKMPPPGRFYNQNRIICDVGEIEFVEQRILTDLCNLTIQIVRLNPDVPGDLPVPESNREFSVTLSLPASSNFSIHSILKEDIFVAENNKKDLLFRVILGNHPTTGTNRTMQLPSITGNPFYASFAPWRNEWGLAVSILEQGKFFFRYLVGD